ncbi:class I SAM-dependent DNA methyltransferase [Rhodococcoides fascians]|uniref:class I SAM-dependent DNA methyltransferase n=1 Tax=Rhodococcoides fascians TaxID=1828 RepID=UPI00050CB840|nr:DNA methyltransferase [Rhodococcus fascians]
MTDNRLLDLVDSRDFRTLFIDELGWQNPDKPVRTIEVEGQNFVLNQVAGYKGLRIWHCSELPSRKAQRQIDVLIGQDNHERLVIFSDESRQQWRWPRRAQLGSANAKLLVHEHLVGDRTTHLKQRLQAIELDFDEDIPLVALLEKMRGAFDHEAETASVAAARLMGTLYSELEASGVGEHDATLLLARLLFLLFGDDADMWRPAGLFDQYLREHTTADTLHNDLQTLFNILDTEERRRELPAGSIYARFRYINGGLFRDELRLPRLTAALRGSLIKASEFDWSIISPAVFGSMFQTVKNKEARRHGGEHYTTEENILKTIRPLFLDDYRSKLDRSWNDKGQLTRLHNELGRLRVFDPACGCGNFLIVAYRELRALELDLLKRRRDLDMIEAATKKIERAQLTLDVTDEIKVTLDHFYGIEIEEWPARIAETALLLVDHLANQQMAVEFGMAPDRLPIVIAPLIRLANALHTDWASLVPPTDDVIIVGNPPFIGQYTKTAQQTADTKAIWGSRYNGYLDYVTCWYAKALDYYGERSGRWAFVSTNSICQGEAVEYLWGPIFEAGWRCRFAHRSIHWLTEAVGGAAVHVSIIGFDKLTSPKPILWEYAEGGKGKGVPRQVENINAYLIDAPNTLVRNRTSPLSPVMISVVYGSKPTDGGNLIVSPADYESVANDPIAAVYLRRYVGAKELVHDRMRWCLWMVDVPQDHIAGSKILRDRVAAVESMRSASTDRATNKAALRPELFQYNRQPGSAYLAIPRHVGEQRLFFTARRFSSDVICGDANFLAPDVDGFLLGILSSSMFIAWMRAIGGRIKSDLRFSNTFTYNTFPMPKVTGRERRDIVESSAGIISAREAHPGRTLAQLYDPTAMPADLVEAHKALDEVVDQVFGQVFDRKDAGAESRRQKVLFEHYAALVH